MARDWNTQRNINKNLRSLGSPGRDIFAKPFPSFTKVLAILLAIFIPLTTILLAANIVFRVPDLYNFEINRTSALEDAEIKIDEDGAIGDLISSYMLHKTDTFQMLHEFRGGKEGLFTDNDKKAMERYRAFLDKTFIILIIIFVISIGGFIFMSATKWIRRLRKVYTVALLFYIAILLGSIAIFLNKGAIQNMLNKVLGVSLGSNDVLDMIFSTSFVTISTLSIIAISLLVMLVGNSIIRYLTKDYRMFD